MTKLDWEKRNRVEREWQMDSTSSDGYRLESNPNAKAKQMLEGARIDKSAAKADRAAKKSRRIQQKNRQVNQGNTKLIKTGMSIQKKETIRLLQRAILQAGGYESDSYAEVSGLIKAIKIIKGENK